MVEIWPTEGESGVLSYVLSYDPRKDHVHGEDHLSPRAQFTEIFTSSLWEGVLPNFLKSATNIPLLNKHLQLQFK